MCEAQRGSNVRVASFSTKIAHQTLAPKSTIYMTWLSPFLTPASLFELGIVAAVFLYLATRFYAQNRRLGVLSQSLLSEQIALQSAQQMIAEARAAGENAQARVNRLNPVLVKDSMVWKRAQLTSRNRSRRPEAALPQQFYDITEEARYWQGAFVFIGLTGTLICLGLAVGYLTILVGRNPAENSTSMAGGLKDVVSHITAVFGGMGAAFLSTASGVGFTLWLSGRISIAERGWERLRDEVEEFSLLEIEPMAAQMLEKTEELPRLEAAVARMEGIANSFNAGLKETLVGLQASEKSAGHLRAASDIAAEKLEKSATLMDDASEEFAGAAGALSGGLDSLQKTLGAHGETLGGATRDWNKIGVTSMDLLRDATERAAQTFLDLGELRADITKETGATQALARSMHDSALTMGNDLRNANLSALSRLGEEVGVGILGVGQAIERGVASEEKLLEQFRAVLEGMGEYAMRVEETIAQLPASMGAEPLFLLENNQDAGLARVGEGIGQLRAEIIGLREAITRELPGAIGQSMGGGLAGVNQNVATLRDEVRGGLSSSRKLDESVANLSAQVNNLNAQVTQLRATNARMERGIVITWPWGK